MTLASWGGAGMGEGLERAWDEEGDSAWGRGGREGENGPRVGKVS